MCWRVVRVAGGDVSISSLASVSDDMSDACEVCMYSTMIEGPGSHRNIQKEHHIPT